MQTPSSTPGDQSAPLFESVPNLSTANDPALLDELAGRMRDAGVQILDQSADPDHHRSVWTWLGSRSAIGRAAASCLDLLGARRSLEDHRGVHPRTGLLDVFPWIPLRAFLTDEAQLLAAGPAIRDSTLEGARDAARAVGDRLAEGADLPTFFYEHAASTAERRDLARHRRMLLRSGTLKIRDDWPCDVGPAQPHPRLGVLLVGARRPLIAFNVDLDTDDVRVAQAIARSIRQSTPGGLPGVKALGLLLPRRGCAQVSVNLIDTRRTDLPHLVSRIRFEAESRDHSIRGGERIGLLTEAAVAGADPADLALEEILPEHLVETHLRRRSLLAPYDGSAILSD